MYDLLLWPYVGVSTLNAWYCFVRLTYEFWTTLLCALIHLLAGHIQNKCLLCEWLFAYASTEQRLWSRFLVSFGDRPNIVPCCKLHADHITPVNCTSSLNSVLSIASSDTQALAGRDPYSLPSSPPPSTQPVHTPSRVLRSEIYSPQPKPESQSLEAARQYEELMDFHSLHEFIIRYGQTLSSTPEFASYGRVYAGLWPIIAQLILQLESVCIEYAVPLVVVDGKVSPVRICPPPPQPPPPVA